MADFQRNLWAPWRMEYIDALHEHAAGCFLCSYRGCPEEDEAHYVLWRGPRTLVLLNRFPYSSGHVLVAPLQHAPTLAELPEDTLLELVCRVRDAQQVLAKACGAQGFNIGFNVGACAAAGLPAHIHCHLLPRWGGDTNYMAVLADVKVMPQSLARMAAAFRVAAAELGLPAPARPL